MVKATVMALAALLALSALLLRLASGDDLSSVPNPAAGGGRAAQPAPVPPAIPGSGASASAQGQAAAQPVRSANQAAAPVLYTYKVVHEYVHDPDAFTQGLEYDTDCSSGACKDVFWESTGMYGQSSVREVELATGAVLREKALAHADFGEGLVKVDGRLLQLTWKSGKAYWYQTGNFNVAQTTKTPLGDGWGATFDNATNSIVLSDGSPNLSFVDPSTLALRRNVQVTDQGSPVGNLNELEAIDGEIWANIWITDCIARVDPQSGVVKSWLVLDGLHTSLRAKNLAGSHPMDVLNGIAYDPATKRIFVTGKYWPRLYQIEPVLAAAQPTAEQLAQLRSKCISPPMPQ
ncbi:hypothetical protein WJX81_005557 [Elliptochloris bilobata]|uniref:Glutamine cyclotransferase n=1 Tax=Elliptochloris bilobata TaxID=381761 RepID=A0AAW1QY92_9CHLO